MIAAKYVDLYARNAGLRDKLIAERDVVLTYALDAMIQDGVMWELAFKGRQSLRSAAFQRAKVRDLYDLYRFAGTPLDGELLRSLLVLKLWQARDPFDSELFFSRLRDGRYDWEDLRRLLRSDERLEPEELLRSVETQFAMLANLTELEHQVIADAKSGWNGPLAERLRSGIQARWAVSKS